MVKCACGKDIATVPSWLDDVKVQFVCNNCPNRELQGITQVDFSIPTKEEEPPKKTVIEDVGDDEEEAEFESEDES